MVKLLLDTAEDHLQEEEAARQFLGWDMEDVLQNDRVLPLVVEQLEWDDRFGRQLFQLRPPNRPRGRWPGGLRSARRAQSRR